MPISNPNQCIIIDNSPIYSLGLRSYLQEAIPSLDISIEHELPLTKFLQPVNIVCIHAHENMMYNNSTLLILNDLKIKFHTKIIIYLTRYSQEFLYTVCNFNFDCLFLASDDKNEIVRVLKALNKGRWSMSRNAIEQYIISSKKGSIYRFNDIYPNVEEVASHASFLKLMQQSLS